MAAERVPDTLAVAVGSSLLECVRDRVGGGDTVCVRVAVPVLERDRVGGGDTVRVVDIDAADAEPVASLEADELGPETDPDGDSVGPVTDRDGDGVLGGVTVPEMVGRVKDTLMSFDTELLADPAERDRVGRGVKLGERLPDREVDRVGVATCDRVRVSDAVRKNG